MEIRIKQEKLVVGICDDEQSVHNIVEQMLQSYAESNTFNAAKNHLSTGIGLPAVIPVNTEVFGIIESTLVIPVRKV